MQLQKSAVPGRGYQLEAEEKDDRWIAGVFIGILLAIGIIILTS